MLNGTLNGTHANGQSRILGADGQPLNSSQAWEKRTQEYGEFAVPHVVTFSSLLGRAWRTYRINRADEAMKHGREEALAMKRDAYLQGLLQERKLAVANRPWRIEVDNERDPRQKQVKEGITRVIKDTWRLNRLRYYLHEGIWYGRYGSQLVYEFADIPLPNPSGGGHPYKQRALRVKMHQPVNGDKIDFKWDGTPLMLVHGSEGTQLPGTRTVITDKGRAVLLEGNLRQRFIVHSHEAVDADFFDADSASAVWGIGIRSTLFWLNWLRQEWLANIADWCERTGLGLRLWYYQGGNDKSKTAVTEAARAQSDKTNILIPRFATGGGQALEGVDYVDTASAGADLLLRLQQHVEEHIERYVIGQTLSSSSEGSGLGGSGVSDFHADTKSNITKFDAGNETDTMTADLVPILVRHTYDWCDFPVRYVVDVDDSNKKERMEAVEKAFSFGVDFREDDVRALTGLDAPQEGERTLRQAQAEMQAMQPKPAIGPDGEEGEVGEPGDGQEPDYEYGDDEGGKHAIDPETGDKLRGDQPDLYPDEEDKGGDKGQYAKGYYDGERWDESKHHRGQPENAGQFGPGGGSSETKPEEKPAESKEGGGKKPIWRKVQSRTGKPVWEHIPTRRRYYQEKQPGQGRQLSPEAQQRKTERENAPPQVAPIGDRTKTAFKDMFGEDVTPEQAAKLIGAPKGLELNVFRNGDRDEISFTGQSHQVSYISRSLNRNAAGELVMSNNMFFLKPLHQGSGLGTDVFSDEVRACTEAGVAEIKTVAGKDRTMNGYYTWPRLGYDAPISEWDIPRLPESLKDCKTVQDLYATEEGRAWWKKHGDTTSMSFDLRPGSKSLKVLNGYLASKGKQTITEPTQEEWQAKKDKQARGQGKADFGGVAAKFGIDDVAWEHFAEQIFNDKMARYNENPAAFGTGRPAAMWSDAYRESAQALIRNPAMANEAPDKSRDAQREQVTGGRVPKHMTKESLDAEARKHFDANPHKLIDRDTRWKFAYISAYYTPNPANGEEQPAQQARDADIGRYSWEENKHPRDDAGRFKEKLSSMSHGDLRRVGGWLVRRLDDDKYRIDTDEGHVIGGAEKIERHIDRHKAKARLEGKAYHAAVKRGESAGDAPDILVDAERAKSEAERFHALPDKTRVVSLADETWGRLGVVERDKKAGRNRVKLDGEPGYVSEWVEPLEEGLSWRSEASGETVSWKKITGETKEGLFVEKDNGTAIIKMADGKLQAVNDESNTLEMLATAKSLLKSGKLHARDKSLLKSAVERAEAGDFSDLPDRLKRITEVVSKQDATNKEQNEQGEKEDLRLAQAYIDQYETPERIRKELSKIDEERNKHSKSKPGQIVSFGGTHDSMRTVMDRKHRLEMALAILEDKKPAPLTLSDLRDDPKPARQSLFAELEEEVQRDLFGGDEPKVRQATLFQRSDAEVGRYSLKDDIENAAAEVDRNPSDAQKEAGTYRKGHVTVQGLPISIENPKGGKRSGKTKDGKEWSVTIAHHYGYIKRTESEADGDHIDVFIGPDPESEVVFIVNQVGKDGKFDEHKCMVGFTNETDAREGYLANYMKGWKCGEIVSLTMDEFKQWLATGDTKKPYRREPGRYGRDGKDEGNGRWITIGAEEGEDGKRHGGSPVYIENGRITKGAPKLVGKKIEAFKEDEEEGPADGGKSRHRLVDEEAPYDHEHANAVVNSANEYTTSTFGKKLKNADILHLNHALESITTNPDWGYSNEQRYDLGNAIQAASWGLSTGRITAEAAIKWRDMNPEQKVRVFAQTVHHAKNTGGSQKDYYEAFKKALEEGPKLPGTKRQQAGQKAAKTRTENEREAGYQRAVWGKKARKEGIEPKHLHQLAADMLAHHGELSKDRAAMLKEARNALDEFGSKHRTIKLSRGKGGKGEIGDATEIPGLDQVAEWAAGKYPHLFTGGAADDQLFGMLSGDDGSGADGKEGWSEADAYEQAFEHLMEAKANPQASTGGDSWDDWEEPGVTPVTPAEDDAVPFARTAQLQFAPANEELLRYAREVEALRAQVATLTAKPTKKRRVFERDKAGRIVGITEIEG